MRLRFVQAFGLVAKIMFSIIFIHAVKSAYVHQLWILPLYVLALLIFNRLSDGAAVEEAKIISGRPAKTLTNVESE